MVFSAIDAFLIFEERLRRRPGILAERRPS